MRTDAERPKNLLTARAFERPTSLRHPIDSARSRAKFSLGAGTSRLPYDGLAKGPAPGDSLVRGGHSECRPSTVLCARLRPLGMAAGSGLEVFGRRISSLQHRAGRG